jgi:acyl-CoA synthetase (AMP-forming)/AMP-acid ligase II
MSDGEGKRGDLVWGTTPRLVRQAALMHGERPAVVDGDLILSYGDLAAAVHQAARAFMAAGIQPGDRASIWAPNISEWIVAALGLHSAGGILVPLNTRFKGTEAGDVIERSGAKILFTVTDFLDTDYVALLRDANGVAAAGRPVAGLPTLERVVVLRGAVVDGTESWSDFLLRGDVTDSAEADARALAVTPADLSDILFTSGTTGQPKGVMTAHGQNLRAFGDWADVVGLRASDRYLVINPFFHAFGYKAGILASLMAGAALYPQLVFDVPQVMRRIEADRITMLPGPPTLYQTILNHPDFGATDFSSLRLAVTGAAPTPVELILEMRRELHFENIITGYGLTESCGIATMCRHDDDPETISSTSGRAIPDLEVRCVDGQGIERPRGEPGEVVVRGYTVMQGYLDDPAETDETIDADGWLHTGDIGVMDERGYLSITDRLKDMFIVGGFNAYPAEIENLLLGHEGIAQVAVVGVPDERQGEVGVAFVVARTGVTLDADELVVWGRSRMANYKAPRRFVVVDALPLNATGKVLKFELRARAVADPT